MDIQEDRIMLKQIIVGIAYAGLSMGGVAAQYEGSGQIYRLDTSAETLNASQTAESLLRINGFASAGSCTIGPPNYVRIVIKNDKIGDRMFSTLLAAQLAGRSVTVLVNDDYKNVGNSCYLQQVRIN
jgi:hypothetical protein